MPTMPTLRELRLAYEGASVDQWRLAVLQEAVRVQQEGTAEERGDYAEQLLREYLALDGERAPQKERVN